MTPPDIEKRRRQDRLRYLKRRHNPQYRRYWKAYSKRHHRKQHLKQYGLSEEDYALLFTLQNGRCAICNDPQPVDQTFSVDHDHDTQVVRSLLCRGCNVGIGQFREDPKRLEAAIQYLRRWGK